MKTEFDRDGKTLRLPDGRTMGYAEYGAPGGTPLLAIHGTPGSRLMLQPASEIAREKGIWLIAPDRPGYGLSSMREDFSLRQWVEDVNLLLAELQINRFYLFGVSGGGPFATAVATMMPERVLGVALVSPVGLFDGRVRENWSLRHRFTFSVLPRMPLLMKLLFPLIRFSILHAPRLPIKIFMHTLSEADRAILSQPRHIEQLLAAFHEGFRIGIEGALADLRLFEAPWQLPLEKADMPIIVWQGMKDLMVPPRAALQLAQALPQVEIIRLEQAGHFWIFDHIEEVLEKLLAGSVS